MPPTGGDNTFTKERAVAVAILLSGLLIDFGRMILEEIRYRVWRLAISLVFPFSITKLCKLEGVLILVGIDEELVAAKKFGIESLKDKPWLEMRVHKSVPEVFGPAS